MDPGLSRRDFLKASSAGLLGLFLADLRLDRVLADQIPRQGRMIDSGIELFDEPFFNANLIHLFRRDEIVEITGAEQGAQGYANPFNSVWYRVNNEGFVYSARVQPVKTQHQKPVFNLPEKGALGEITVPFCDTRRAMSIYAERGYRIYYATTHWITETIVNRDEKSIWYKIFDSQLKESFYVPTHEMRMIPPSELLLLSPEVPEESKRIYIDLASQTVTAFEEGESVFVARCATGAKGTETSLGNFRTYHKGPSIHMTNQGDGTDNTYHLPGVPWVSFFTGSGVALHGTYWHNDYGRPSSRGCVNLTPSDSKFLYRWTRPEVPPEIPYLFRPGGGTLVQVVSSA